MAIQRSKPKDEKRHYLRHPIQEVKRVHKQTTEAVNQRKQQIIESEQMPTYNQQAQMQMLLVLLLIGGGILLFLWIVGRL